MSWLPGNLSQSVSGRLSQISGQISGQLKDILSDTTDDVVDPNTELKVVSDKLKENERRCDLLKMECDRWQEESNELNLKCKTLEAQLDQRNNEYRSQIMQKDSQINELRKQVNNLQEIKNNETFDVSTNYQKSALMEEFEELMPPSPSELNDFIHLQREMKRLNEDNTHLRSENKQLISKLKKFENKKSDLVESTSGSVVSNQQKIEYESTIEDLKQEILKLKNRLETDKDNHQQEIIGIQNSYANKTEKQLKEKQNEIEISRIKLEELQAKFDEKQKEFDDLKTSNKISSNKSDDGWCLNGDEINFDSLDKMEVNDLKKRLNEKDSELIDLKNQIEMFENDLEQANSLISRLKAASKSSKSTSEDQQKEEIENLKKKLEESHEKHEKQLKELESQDKLIDELQLELKQHKQTLQQEKLMQMQEQKQERQELAKLKMENTELKIKLDEKLSEIKLLGDQINDLNTNVNSLKSTDSSLFNELKQKTEEFMKRLDVASDEIASLKSENERLVEQRKQFEFVLDEKGRESYQLKNDIQKHLQHISAQSRAIEKLQEELKVFTDREANKEPLEKDTSNLLSLEEEFNQLKQQYNQIYSYLEQKQAESLSYYNEIQRLNAILSELNNELLNTKSVNENLNEQYDNLVKECQLEQKMVDDLNQQIEELNKTFLSVGMRNNFRQEALDVNVSIQEAKVSTSEIEIQTDLDEADLVINKTDDEQLAFKKEEENEEINLLKQEQERLVRQSKHDYENYQSELSILKKQNEDLVSQILLDTKKEEDNEHIDNDSPVSKEIELKKEIDEIRLKLSETTNYYEGILIEQNENFKETLLNEEKLQTNLSKELAELRAHLAEMTDNYNREMVQAEEREKKILLALNNAEEMLQKQNADLENLKRELEFHKTNNSKWDETKQYYENQVNSLNEQFMQRIASEEQQQMRLNKELERLREHLVEMSDSYNREAIEAEEREKQLRLRLNDAQQALQKQGANLESSSKELEYKLESLNQINLDLKNEKEKLSEKLKQTEENLNHQVKVTKNLELVLERLQNDKESMHSTEITRYQHTIKEQAASIHSLQSEAQSYKAQIENLKSSLDSANIFMEELERKDEILNQSYQAQIATKDAIR